MLHTTYIMDGSFYLFSMLHDTKRLYKFRDTMTSSFIPLIHTKYQSDEMGLLETAWSEINRPFQCSGTGRTWTRYSGYA